jgi:Mce-associated membrane protein
MDVTGRDRRPDGATAQEAATAEPDGQSGQPPRRPLPGPSPTSRARRVAAAGGPVRRPSPRPRPGHSADGAHSTEAGAVPVATATKPGEAAKPERRSAPQAAGRAPLWLAVLLGALVLAGAAGMVLAAVLPVRSGSTGERDRALAAAKSEVPLILSYDYTSFDAGLAKAKAQLTGRAVTDYTTAMVQSIKPAAIKAKAVVQAQTDGAGVESVSPDGRQVTVVVLGEQKVTNSTLSAPRTDLFRVRATLDLVDGHWLISKFDQI